MFLFLARLFSAESQSHFRSVLFCATPPVSSRLRSPGNRHTNHRKQDRWAGCAQSISPGGLAWQPPSCLVKSVRTQSKSQVVARTRVTCTYNRATCGSLAKLIFNSPIFNSTNQIFRSVGFFGYFGQKFGIRGAEHHKIATMTRHSPTSFPVIQ